MSFTARLLVWRKSLSSSPVGKRGKCMKLMGYKTKLEDVLGDGECISGKIWNETDVKVFKIKTREFQRHGGKSHHINNRFKK